MKESGRSSQKGRMKSVAVEAGPCVARSSSERLGWVNAAQAGLELWLLLKCGRSRVFDSTAEPVMLQLLLQAGDFCVWPAHREPRIGGSD
jgi:hypothetical protein